MTNARQPGSECWPRHDFTVTYVVSALLCGSLCIQVSGCQSSKFDGCEATRTCRTPDSSGGEAGAEGGTEAGAESGGHAGVGAGGSGAGPSTGDTGSAETSAGGVSGAAGTGSAPCEGACEPAACCDGECVELAVDSAHCGECGVSCEFDAAQAECREGRCALVACEGEFLDCNGLLDDGCEAEDLGIPATPIQSKPKIGAYTGSLHARDSHDTLRPHFSWHPVAAAGCGAVTYHLQVDNSCDIALFQDCDFSSPELDEAQLTETDFTPSDDLPVEEALAPLGARYFWRVRACDDTGRCSSWSEVRYVDVGRLKADLTGDGYADIVALDASLFPVVLYQGAEGFGEDDVGDPVDVPSSTEFAEPIWYGEEFNNPRLRLLGDVNGDGFNDFGAPGPSAVQTGTDQQVMYVFLGASEAAEMRAIKFEITATVSDPAVYPAGDFDADGFADFLLAASTVEGQAVLYRGGTALSELTLPEAIIGAPAGYSKPDYGKNWETGDFNGDGRSDLVTTLEAEAMLHVFYGSPDSDVLHDAYVPFIHCSTARLATLDSNADGLDELVATCLWEGHTTFFQGPLTEGLMRIFLDEYSLEFVGGDIDGDGQDDLLMGYPLLYAGGESLTDHRIPNTLADFFEPFRPVALADHNGDGLLDLVVGGKWYRGNGSFTPEHSVNLTHSGSPFEPASLAR